MMKKSFLVVVFLVITLLFSSCSELGIVSESVSIDYTIENGEATVSKVPDNSTMKIIDIPDEYDGMPVTKIADFAAVNLENVTQINIGKNVKDISSWAFENSRYITAFEVNEENPYFCDIDGVLFTKDMKTLLFYPPARGIEIRKADDGTEYKAITYAIPESVEVIRTKAFYKCYEMTELTIPSGVTTIEEKAFFRCGLKDITLPVNLKTIGKDAFAYCSSLNELEIPASVTEIGDYAFYNCTGLLKLVMNGQESDMTLGKKWYPTNNGLDIDNLVVEWK